MNHKINNLEELLREKSRLQTQINIVQNELNASLSRTRLEFKTLLDGKFSLSKQLSQLFQGNAKPTAGNTALRTLGNMAGGSSWWGGLAATLLPMLVDFIRRQIERRKQRRAAKPAGQTVSAKSKVRKLFRRKKAGPDVEA